MKNKVTTQQTTTQQTSDKFVKLWLQTSEVAKEMYSNSGYATIFDEFATNEDFENLNAHNYYLGNLILDAFCIIDRLFDSFQDDLENNKERLDAEFTQEYATGRDFLYRNLNKSDIDLLETLNVDDLIANYMLDYYNFTVKATK